MSGKILLVEDESSVAGFVLKGLGEEGYSVTVGDARVVGEVETRLERLVRHDVGATEEQQVARAEQPP